MRTTKNAVAVGLVTLVILTGLYLGIDYVSETRETRGQYRVWAIFPDASGLVEKSRIRMAGIPVGYIEKIGLHPLDAPAPRKDGLPSGTMGARVDMVLEEGGVLHKDAMALRSAGSILGDQFIVLLPGSADLPVLKDGDRVERVGEAGLMGNLGKITGDIQEVTNNLKTVFGSEAGGQQMGEVLANMRDISRSIDQLLKQNSETVTRTLENLDRITSDSQPGIHQIVADMGDITSKLRVFVDQNTNKAGDAIEGADQTVKEIRTAVTKLDSTLENLEKITDGVEQGEGTVGRLLKDDKLIDDVEGVTGSAGEFVDQLYRMRTIVGLAGEYNFYDNTLKTTLSLRLQPREDKYYLIEAIIDPRGATTQTERVVETTNPNEPAQYRETVTETTDTLLFSFMFARRIHFATFRFGIKESSGGLGLDLHALRDRLEISTDLYRFGDDVYPRLKGLMAMEFLKHLYIIGGVNDILNQNRDFFVGMMLRFDDEDLKAMMMVAPNI